MNGYTTDQIYNAVLMAAFAFVAVVAVSAWFVPSPYGRFSSGRFGLRLDPRLGWFLMELPASVVFFAFYFTGERRFEPVPLFFLCVWTVHYLNRGFLFPLLIRQPRGDEAGFSLMIVVFGWASTILHGYLNARFISGLAPHLTAAWFADPRFVCGATLYAVSLALNVHSDAVVRNLRSREEVNAGRKVYRIPQGGLFRWVTNASYLTELTAWTGFALATWSPAGVYILGLSLANLIPRAVATHRWYRKTFPDYPPSRRVLIPWLW